MQSFRSLSDVEHARLPPNIRSAVTRAVRNLLAAYPDYDPDDDGYVVLVDRTTTDRHAVELFGVPWVEVRLEGVNYQHDDQVFESCNLANNHYGLTIVVPDLLWLDPRFRAKLVAEMGGAHVP